MHKFQKLHNDFEISRIQQEVQDNYVSIDKNGNIHLKGNVYCDSVFLSKNSLHVGSKKLETPEGTDNDRLLIYNHTTEKLEWVVNTDVTNSIITSTTTVSDDATEQTLFTGSIPAGTLKAGNLLKMHCSGELTNATASDDITFNIYIGSDLIQTYKPAIGNVTGADWHAEAEITIRDVGPTASIAESSYIVIDGNESRENDSATTIDTNVAEDLTLKVQWDNAKAGNTISIYQGYVEMKINK